MAASTEERVAKLEERQEGLERAQSRMWKRLESMDDHLQAIQKTLNKIFYTALGLGFAYVAQEIGVVEVLRKVLL